MLPEFKNVVELQQAFPDDDHCRRYLKLVLWDGEPQGCVHCGSAALYAYADNHNYRCRDCNLQFNVLHGTIFENSKVSLVKWFIAIYLTSTQKRGLSSYQLAKIIGVTQKTSWFMLHRLRQIFSTMSPSAVAGDVVVDETYIGGKYKNKHKNKRKPHGQGRALVDKVLVFGAMEKGGMIKTRPIYIYSDKGIRQAALDIITPGSFVISDEHRAYQHLGKQYVHTSVNHSWYEYVNSEGRTTNPIENAWSHLKRAIIGTHYQVSPKHLHRYLWEFEYKFNTRGIDEPRRFSAVMVACHIRLRYRQLITE